MSRKNPDRNWGFGTLIKNGMYADRDEIEGDIDKVLDIAESQDTFTAQAVAAALGIDEIAAALLCTGLVMDGEIEIKTPGDDSSRVFALKV